MPRVVAWLFAVALLSACKDLPTSPHAFQMLADGRDWVAVNPPERLPDLSTWLPYLSASGPEGQARAAEVRMLQRESAQARAGGELERAAELRREAARRAVLSLQSSPGPVVFADGLAALDQWTERVRRGVRLEEVPALAMTLDSVRLARAQTVEALSAGDSLQAALRLAEAAERIREWSPHEMALRVLDRAEQRLRASAGTGSAAERAAHLLQSARQELIAGDPRRALQRALYALQLAGGNQMREPPPEAAPECGELSC